MNWKKKKEETNSKSLIQKNPYKNNIDLNKRIFIKKGVLGIAAGVGIAAFSKIANARYFFSDGTSQATAGSGATKEFIVYSTRRSTGIFPYPSVVGDFSVNSIDMNEGAYFMFYTPNDFTSLTDAVVMTIPNANETIQWDALTDFGANGESSTANSDSALNETVSATQSQIVDCDISAALTGLAAGDYVGVEFESDTTSIRPTMLRFRYS
tara:strand:+ start:4060 stop:4689 length:630 start_codon:yes stop_codon:yes gene_type:complete